MQKVAPLHPREILFEDNHLLVVNKRAGLATMGVGADQVSLSDLAKDYIRKKHNKPGNVYLGIVSRLDARTSGAIVLARTSKAAARLTKQFKDRTTRKRYWAIVKANNGHDSLATSGCLENLMFKDEAAMKMRCVPGVGKRPVPPNTKEAKLSWSILGTFRDHHVLEIKLLTGRKHQIRCQFANAGFPVVGDRKYGSKAAFTESGIALHSKFIEFIHPTLKIPQQFDVAVPDYWKIARYNL